MNLVPLSGKHHAKSDPLTLLYTHTHGPCIFVSEAREVIQAVFSDKAHGFWLTFRRIQLARSNSTGFLAVPEQAELAQSRLIWE